MERAGWWWRGGGMGGGISAPWVSGLPVQVQLQNLDITQGQGSHWQSLFAITRSRYIEVLFHMFYYYWGRENRSLYRGLRYKEVRYIEVPLYCYRRKIWIFIFTFMCDQIDQRDTDSINSNRE